MLALCLLVVAIGVSATDPNPSHKPHFQLLNGNGLYSEGIRLRLSCNRFSAFAVVFFGPISVGKSRLIERCLDLDNRHFSGNERSTNGEPHTETWRLHRRPPILRNLCLGDTPGFRDHPDSDIVSNLHGILRGCQTEPLDLKRLYFVIDASKFASLRVADDLLRLSNHFGPDLARRVRFVVNKCDRVLKPESFWHRLESMIRDQFYEIFGRSAQNDPAIVFVSANECIGQLIDDILIAGRDPAIRLNTIKCPAASGNVRNRSGRDSDPPLQIRRSLDSDPLSTLSHGLALKQLRFFRVVVYRILKHVPTDDHAVLLMRLKKGISDHDPAEFDHFVEYSLKFQDNRLGLIAWIDMLKQAPFYNKLSWDVGLQHAEIISKHAHRFSGDNLKLWMAFLKHWLETCKTLKEEAPSTAKLLNLLYDLAALIPRFASSPDDLNAVCDCIESLFADFVMLVVSSKQHAILLELQSKLFSFSCPGVKEEHKSLMYRCRVNECSNRLQQCFRMYGRKITALEATALFQNAISLLQKMRTREDCFAIVKRLELSSHLLKPWLMPGFADAVESALQLARNPLLIYRRRTFPPVYNMLDVIRVLLETSELGSIERFRSDIMPSFIRFYQQHLSERSSINSLEDILTMIDLDEHSSPNNDCQHEIMSQETTDSASSSIMNRCSACVVYEAMESVYLSWQLLAEKYHPITDDQKLTKGWQHRLQSRTFRDLLLIQLRADSNLDSEWLEKVDFAAPKQIVAAMNLLKLSQEQRNYKGPAVVEFPLKFSGTIIMHGRIAAGKSTFIGTILKKADLEAFVGQSNPTEKNHFRMAATHTSNLHQGEIQPGCELNMIDTPGFGELEEQCREDSLKQIDRAIELAGSSNLLRIYYAISCKRPRSYTKLRNNLQQLRWSYGEDAFARVRFMITHCDQDGPDYHRVDDLKQHLLSLAPELFATMPLNYRIICCSAIEGRFEFYSDLLLAVCEPELQLSSPNRFVNEFTSIENTLNAPWSSNRMRYNQELSSKMQSAIQDTISRMAELAGKIIVDQMELNKFKSGASNKEALSEQPTVYTFLPISYVMANDGSCHAESGPIKTNVKFSPKDFLQSHPDQRLRRSEHQTECDLLYKIALKNREYHLHDHYLQKYKENLAQADHNLTVLKRLQDERNEATDKYGELLASAL